MNDRQIALHEFLLAHPFEYTKRVDILCALKEWYYEPNVTEFDIREDKIYYSNAGAILNKDIKTIKKESTKILIGSSYKGIKYATEEEAVEYFIKRKEARIRAYAMDAIQIKLLKLNNQINIIGYVVESVVE